MNTQGPQPEPAAGLELLLRIHQRLSAVLAAPATAAQAAPRIVGAFAEPMDWACGALWSRDPEAADRLVCLGAWGVDTPGIAEYLGYTQARRPILHAAGLVGAAWLGAAPVWVADVSSDDTYRRVPIALRAGLRCALALPVAVGEQVLGVIELCSTAVTAEDAALLAGLPLLGGEVAQFLLRAQAQQQLSDSEQRLRSLTQLSSDWLWELDAQLRFQRVEGRGVGRSGATVAPLLLGRRPWEVTGLVPGSRDWDELRTALERHEPLRDFECVWREDKGERLHLSLNADAVHDLDGRFAGYRGTVRDLTLHRQAAQRLQYLSTHDELTGLPNRAALLQLLGQAVELAKRYERSFALLVFNLDRFHRINDGLGRAAGDALLRELGQRMKKALRASEVVARLDADEFAVLAHELPDARHAEAVARKLLDAVGAPVSLREGEVRITACAGVATYPLDAHDVPGLLKHAGAALRAAKREGANRVHHAPAKAGSGGGGARGPA